jgi:hypothetical protein
MVNSKIVFFCAWRVVFLEVTISSENFVSIYQTTRRHIADDLALYQPRCEKLKSRVGIVCSRVCVVAGRAC